MATLTQVTRTCDVCGGAKDIRTWTFGLDGKTYEVDLCPKDGKELNKIKTGYIPKARKATVPQSQRRGSQRARSRGATQDGAKADRSRRAAKVGDVKAEGAGPGSGREAKAGRSQKQAPRASDADAKSGGAGSRQQASPGRSQKRASRARDADAQGGGAGSRQQANAGRSEAAASNRAAPDTGTRQEKGIYVYGILPADIDVTAEISGVRGSPLRAVRSDGLAALVSEVDLSGELGSPDDEIAHREILDATASEVPVLPVRFGTVLASADAVAEELLAANRDEFAAALEQLDGCAEFLVKGRYVEKAILDEVLSENKQAARLRDTIQREDPDSVRDARAELDEIISKAVAAIREEDTQVVQEAMEGLCVASVVREPAGQLDAVHVAFLVAVDQESEVEQVIDDLAREWAGWIDVELLGPVAAYDFVGSAKPEG